MNFFDELAKYDSEVYEACSLELNLQRENIELIASENIVSKAVLLAAGTVLTNKYAEGFPGKRYYGGCQYVDIVENLARDRAKKLFGAEHANVQPHSGASANLAVFFALLNAGDTVMGLNLAHGGHLSHGSPVNISGKYFNVVPYSVSDQNEMLDYEEIRQVIDDLVDMFKSRQHTLFKRHNGSAVGVAADFVYIIFNFISPRVPVINFLSSK